MDILKIRNSKLVLLIKKISVTHGIFTDLLRIVW